MHANRGGSQEILENAPIPRPRGRLPGRRAGQAASGTGFELDVITAVVLGGVSISGGEGRLEGTLIGVLIIGILANGLVLMDVQPYYQLVIKGMALLFAVGLDRLRKRRG